jgi:hypothetical protein
VQYALARRGVSTMRLLDSICVVVIVATLSSSLSVGLCVLLTAAASDWFFWSAPVRNVPPGGSVAAFSGKPMLRALKNSSAAAPAGIANALFQTAD